MARRTILLIAAIVIAALGTGMILLYVQGINKRAEEGQELVEVLVAVETITLGETSEEAQADAKIEKRTVRRVDAVPGVAVEFEDLEGEALQTIRPGEQLLVEDFGEVGIAPPIVVPDDKIAIAIELSDQDRVAGFVDAGTEVAVFFSGAVKELDDEGLATDRGQYVQLIIPRVSVIGVGQTSLATQVITSEDEETQQREEVARTVVTLAVTQEEAEQLIFAQKFGVVTLGLLNDESATEVDFGATLADVIPQFFRRL